MIHIIVLWILSWSRKTKRQDWKKDNRRKQSSEFKVDPNTAVPTVAVGVLKLGDQSL